ncbi:QWRF motif-containing protein [Drosera capensis]
MMVESAATPTSTSSSAVASNMKRRSNLIPNHRNSTRPPLLPSETDDNVAAGAAGVGTQRRNKIREVSSRYLSTTSTSTSSTYSSCSTSSSSSCSGFGSRRFGSPMNSGVGATPSRSLSVERAKRPGTPMRNGGEMSAAARMLVSNSLSSRRSLSVSFQGESFSMPLVNKAKQVAVGASSPSVRKGVTPERRRASMMGTTTTRKDADQGEQHRWPARSRLLSCGGNFSKSVDLGSDRKRSADNGSGHVVRAMHQDVTSEGERTVQKAEDNLRKSVTSIRSGKGGRDDNFVGCDNLVSVSGVALEQMALDLESVSPESNVVDRDNGSGVEGLAGARVIVVPSRFLQETNSRLRRAPEPGSPISRGSAAKAMFMPKANVPKKTEVDARAPSPSPRGSLKSRGLSPLRGGLRTPSPSKLGSSLILEKSLPLRALASPIRVRNVVSGALSNNVNSTPSVLSFAADVRRGKVGENRIGDAHFLRLLYNRQLQWRFCNAQAGVVLSNQNLETERSLYNAWKTISELRGAVSAKRKELQWMRQKLKLTSILKGLISCLEEWQIIEMDHSSSLSGAIESLKASIIRLPLLCGARADIQSVKDAICSSLDVMLSVASSICSMLPKVEKMNALVGDVASLSFKERVLLDECKVILSTLTAMQDRALSWRA